MSNFLKLGGDEKNHGGNADWEAQVKKQWVIFVTHKCISQQSEQKLENFSQQFWNYRLERKFNKYLEERQNPKEFLGI